MECASVRKSTRHLMYGRTAQTWERLLLFFASPNSSPQWTQIRPFVLEASSLKNETLTGIGRRLS